MKSTRHSKWGKLFSILVAVFLLTSLLPMMAFAEESAPGIDPGNITFGGPDGFNLIPPNGGVLDPLVPGDEGKSNDTDLTEDGCPECDGEPFIGFMAAATEVDIPNFIIWRYVGFHCNHGGSGNGKVKPTNYKDEIVPLGQLAPGQWVLLMEVTNPDGTKSLKLNTKYACPDCGNTFFISYSNQSDGVYG